MSSSNSPAPQLPTELNLGLTYGAYFIGLVIAAMLYGILVSQTIFYFNQYPKDPTRLKLLVASLLILETLTIILETYGLYRYLIVTFGNFEELAVVLWSIQVEPLIAYTIMLITQSFFVLRIWELNGRKFLLPGIVSLLSLAAFATAFAVVVGVFATGSWNTPPLVSDVRLVAANKALETGTDVMITGALWFYLHRGRSQIKRTNTMIDKLIIYTVNRGAITTFLQLCYLITYEVSPNSLAWAAFHIAISKVYSNTVLATLNSRNVIRGVGEDEEIISTRLANESIKFSNSNLPGNELTIIQTSRQIEDESGGTHTSKPHEFSASGPVEIRFQKAELVESA